MNHDFIFGSDFVYMIDTSYGLSQDGYIATGTESIVYKGIKISRDEKIRMSCVLKFKYKSIKIGTKDGEYRRVDVLDRFKSSDLSIFNELQSCRSVVRIYDIIEDLENFICEDRHVPNGKDYLYITRDQFFCVVEEYIDGWSLEEYCRDEYWKLTEEIDIGNNLKQKKLFHDFSDERKQDIIKSYHRDYEEIIRYQSEIFRFMINLCEIMEYITDEKDILHLDIKPDNIMVTRHGRELVLIDFGRSEHRDVRTKSVISPLGEADYNKNERIARMFQYGTLGYAAPECYAQPMGGSNFPFDDSGFEKGTMTVESDIFSFGATFWECLNMFELYTGSREFAKDKNFGGSYDFYRSHILNDESYCDRDLSLTSPHYHEKLEEIIKKCTRKRTPGYLHSPMYYHDYEELKRDIIFARDSAPALVKTENIKVRNSFGVVGVMSGLLAVLLAICLLLKVTGSYFAKSKLDNIMNNYNPTKIEQLEEAALEQMQSSTENQKHSVYDKSYDFLLNNDMILEYKETVTLIDLLKVMEDVNFVNDSVDTILLNVDKKGFSNCVEYIVTNLPESESLGYKLAVQIFNAQKRINLDECYAVLQENADNEEFRSLVLRLAQELNHDEIITQIAELNAKNDSEINSSDTNQYNIRMAEIKHEIKEFLDNIK